MLLTIDSGGTTRCIYTEALDLESIGTATIVRASHVEPGQGGWYADMVNGPKLGPFTKRSKALAEEVKWIEENALGTDVDLFLLESRRAG